MRFLLGIALYADSRIHNAAIVRLMGAVLLLGAGVLVAFARGWWVVGIGLMIVAGVLLSGGRRGRRRRRRSRW